MEDTAHVGPAVRQAELADRALIPARRSILALANLAPVGRDE
jgi:hypothetical protein